MKNLQIPNYSNVNILVIGDVMLDSYWLGNTERISPEAPVPVTLIKDKQHKPGGAGNVALNLSSLGAQVSLISQIGKDEAGAKLTNLLTENKVNCLFCIDKQHITNNKLRVISSHQQLIRLDLEKPEPITVNKSNFEKLFTKSLKNQQVIIVSDYAKGVITDLSFFVKAAKQYNIPVLVDPKQPDYSIYKGADIITPNIKEFEEIVGKCSNYTIMTERAQQLIANYDLQALLITQGEKGLIIVESNKPYIHVPAHSKEVFDVTGAGDTMIATLGASLAAGKSLLCAAQIANAAAGIVVGKLGTSTINTHELAEHINYFQFKSYNSPAVVKEQPLLEKIKQLKKHGKKIVFTNGCFDILHPGHINYLKEAKTLGDILIIAINTDLSIRGLKGPSRPINKLADRIAMLAALTVVDFIIAFADDTPEKLIRSLKPDVLVKGGDYTNANKLPGAKFVLDNGGEVKILSLVSGYSTTNIINKIESTMNKATKDELNLY